MHELATVPFAPSRDTDWRACSHAALQITERAPKSAVLLKAGRGADVPASLGVPEANQWTLNGDTQLLWQGPREWLLLSDSAPASVLVERTKRLVGPITAAVVDVTDRTLRLDIRGLTAADVLAKGTSLDAALLVSGACCRTRFANLQATVLRSEASSDFTLITDRATAVYLHAWLTLASR